MKVLLYIIKFLWCSIDQSDFSWLSSKLFEPYISLSLSDETSEISLFKEYFTDSCAVWINQSKVFLYADCCKVKAGKSVLIIIKNTF